MAGLRIEHMSPMTRALFEKSQHTYMGQKPEKFGEKVKQSLVGRVLLVAVSLITHAEAVMRAVYVCFLTLKSIFFVTDPNFVKRQVAATSAAYAVSLRAALALIYKEYLATLEQEEVQTARLAPSPRIVALPSSPPLPPRVVTPREAAPTTRAASRMGEPEASSESNDHPNPFGSPFLRVSMGDRDSDPVEVPSRAETSEDRDVRTYEELFLREEVLALISRCEELQQPVSKEELLQFITTHCPGDKPYTLVFSEKGRDPQNLFSIIVDNRVIPFRRDESFDSIGYVATHPFPDETFDTTGEEEGFPVALSEKREANAGDMAAAVRGVDAELLDHLPSGESTPAESLRLESGSPSSQGSGSAGSWEKIPS